MDGREAGPYGRHSDRVVDRLPREGVIPFREEQPGQPACAGREVARNGTSRLNQFEIRFSILARKLPRRGSFTSQQDLKERIEQFIAYCNGTMAKPLKWTKTGKPLAA